MIKLELNKKFIKKLYVKEAMTILEIAAILKVSYGPIRNCLIENRVKLRKGCKPLIFKNILTKDFLEVEYSKKRKNIEQIAKTIKCASCTVLKYLKSYNIPRRDGRSLGPKGENHPNYIKRIETICDYCGKRLLFRPREFKKQKYHFCNKICSYKFRIGDKSSNWKNGESIKPYSPDFNEKLKLEIRERDDFTCQLCGITEEEHIIVFGNVLHIHHIDYDKMKCDKNKLITLCCSCNSRVNFNREYWQEYFTQKIKEIYSQIK